MVLQLFLLLPLLSLVTCQNSQCDSAQGLNLKEIGSQTRTFHYDHTMYRKITLALCDKIDVPCGISGECTAANCCAFCQLWRADPDFDGACLGKNYKGSYAEGNQVVLHYVGGDAIVSPTPGPREVKYFLTCDPSSEFRIGEFGEPYYPDSNGVYMYNLTVFTKAACRPGILSK